MPPSIILVTGATGYIGGHIARQAVDAGYAVRITVRPAKLDAAKEQFKEKVEIFTVTDVSIGDYSEALKGVDAVIHVAAPLTGRASPEIALKATVEGSLSILRQALSAGVQRVIVTSTFGTHFNPAKPELVYSDYLFTDKDWNPTTKDRILAPGTSPFHVYLGSKTIAEQELWNFADEHPEIDITTIDPPFCYGPLPKGAKATKEILRTYSTVCRFYLNALQEPGEQGEVAYPQVPLPVTVDVRDVAKAHILALSAPLSRNTDIGHKRILVGGHNFTWRDAIQHLRTSRPELVAAGRLKGVSASFPAGLELCRLDNSRAQSLLGLKEFIHWTKTVEDMVDSILEIERAT